MFTNPINDEIDFEFDTQTLLAKINRKVEDSSALFYHFKNGTAQEYYLDIINDISGTITFLPKQWLNNKYTEAAIHEEISGLLSKTASVLCDVFHKSPQEFETDLRFYVSKLSSEDIVTVNTLKRKNLLH